MTPVANCHRYQQHRWKICHRYQRHRRQILPPVPLVLLKLVANLPPVSPISAANLPPVSTTPVANCHRYQRHRRQIRHRCQWHRWQIMGTISGCRNLKVHLKAKINIYVNSTTQRCPNKIIKISQLDDFFPFAIGVVYTGGAPWAANISANFRKIRNVRNSILRCLGETDPWKKPEVENLVTLSI